MLVMVAAYFAAVILLAVVVSQIVTEYRAAKSYIPRLGA